MFIMRLVSLETQEKSYLTKKNCRGNVTNHFKSDEHFSTKHFFVKYPHNNNVKIMS